MTKHLISAGFAWPSCNDKIKAAKAAKLAKNGEGPGLSAVDLYKHGMSAGLPGPRAPDKIKGQNAAKLANKGDSLPNSVFPCKRSLSTKLLRKT